MKNGEHLRMTAVVVAAYPNLCLASFAPAPSAISFASAISRRIGAMPQLVVGTMLLAGKNGEHLRMTASVYLHFSFSPITRTRPSGICL